MRRIPILIPDEHHELLRKLAFEKRSSIAEEIRKAIANYLGRDKLERKKSRES